jgi:hypothetical protein
LSNKRASGDKEEGLDDDERRDRWLAAAENSPKVDEIIAQKATPVKTPTKKLRKTKITQYI